MITKTELRKKAKEIRISLEIEKISERIVKNILNLNIYKKAKHVMIFYPIKHEINLLPLLQDKTKSFYLPKVQEEELLVCPYKTNDKLIVSKFKTQEPVSEPISSDILDIVFVPALMVDKNFNRLGYGGGFYDKFLCKNAQNATKIVAIPNKLVINELPSDSFDARINVIICENIL